MKFLADHAARNFKKGMMEDSDWIISEAHFDPAFNRAYEGLFTVSSGTLHLRGSLEEHLLDAPQNLDYVRKPTNVTAERFLEFKAKWGTYIPAIRAAHPLLNRGIVNLPFFLPPAPLPAAALAAPGISSGLEGLPGLCRDRPFRGQADQPRPGFPAGGNLFPGCLAWTRPERVGSGFAGSKRINACRVKLYWITAWSTR